MTEREREERERKERRVKNGKEKEKIKNWGLIHVLLILPA